MVHRIQKTEKRLLLWWWITSLKLEQSITSKTVEHEGSGEFSICCTKQRELYKNLPNDTKQSKDYQENTICTIRWYLEEDFRRI